MDRRPVFVLTTAKNCIGCTIFKREWNSLNKELLKQGRVKVVTIEVPTTQSKPDPKRYHKDLSRFIGWFPTMSLFPGDRWNDHSSELIGIVKNGKIVPPKTVNGKLIPEHIDTVGTVDKASLSKRDILNWVNYTLDRDRIFTRSKNNHDRDNIVILNSGEPVHYKKIRVPTAGHYAKFKPSKVE